MTTRTPLPLRIVLIAPPPGVAYGIQRGAGNDYDVMFTQTPKHGDVVFDFDIDVAEGKNGAPNFLGEYAQGKVGRRFIYVDVGRYAKVHDTWARRMIVRLDDVTWPLIQKAVKPGKRLEARVPGTHADGGPTCATVEILGGWSVVAE